MSLTASLATYRNQASEGLRGYLQVLAGARPAGKLIEIRYATTDGMGQLFVPARRVDRAAAAVRSLAEHHDVYVGVLLRTCRAGGRDAVAGSHLAWVDIDQPDAVQRIRQFDRMPSMIVATGSRGHRHCYWQMEHEIPPDVLVAANRRLAHRLGGDLATVDPARILRPPGSLNRKHSPPAAVTLIELHADRRYAVQELVGELPDPPLSPRATTSAVGALRVARGRLDEQLLAIPTADYVRALAGLEANRAGKVRCPFHDPDDTPSLHCYNDGTWFCFGACQTGGSIYDFAARLWSTGTKGREFLALRARLAAELNLVA